MAFLAGGREGSGVVNLEARALAAAAECSIGPYGCDGCECGCVGSKQLQLPAQAPKVQVR